MLCASRDYLYEKDQYDAQNYTQVMNLYLLAVEHAIAYPEVQKPMRNYLQH
jgi:hypothetical protein